MIGMVALGNLICLPVHGHYLLQGGPMKVVIDVINTNGEDNYLCV